MTATYTDRLMKTAPIVGVSPSVCNQLMEGTLPSDKFRNLVIQDIILNEHWKKFIAILIAKIPQKYSKSLGDKNPTLFLASYLTNHQKEKVNDRIRHELKIKNEEIHPSVVTKAACDFLMATVYNRTYKDALIALFASCKCLPEKVSLSGSNPLFDEWSQTHMHSVDILGSWAIKAINEIRGDDEVNHKHQQLYEYALKYENTFWESIENPDNFSWAM